MKIYQCLEYSVKERIAYITLNRPDVHNALNDVLLIELKDALLRVENAALVKIVVLNAHGPYFCEGIDLDYAQRLQGASLDQNIADSLVVAEIYQMIYRSSKIFIAQVEGHAFADGAGLVTVCDFSYIVPEAQLGFVEARTGFVPAMIMSFLLRKVGETRGKELMLAADIISANKALRYNLINNIIPPEQIKGYVFEFANRLCHQNSAAAMQLTKKMTADMPDLPLNSALQFAAKMNAHARMNEDCVRGVKALLNKEEISW